MSIRGASAGCKHRLVEGKNIGVEKSIEVRDGRKVGCTLRQSEFEQWIYFLIRRGERNWSDAWLEGGKCEGGGGSPGGYIQARMMHVPIVNDG